MNSSYITEYLFMSGEQRELKLSHAVHFSKEMQRYALLQDTFTLHAETGTLTLAGAIEKRENAYYLTFDNSELDNSSNYTASVTYLVADSFTLYEETVLPVIANSSNVFVEEDNTSYLSIDTTQYITKNIDYVASQYRESNRLKSVISATLEQLQESFTVGGEIPKILNLDLANGIYLDLIGKIVGVSRHYCGNFLQTLNCEVSSYQVKTEKIEEVTLTDNCMRKLIKVKILKNTKEIVNYKELKEILSIFLGAEVKIETCGEYSIKIPIKGGIDDELRKCLVLLRAFLPLPPTIQLLYLEVMEFPIDEIAYITSYGIQKSTLYVQKAPIIPIKLEDKEYVVQHHYQVGVIKVKDE